MTENIKLIDPRVALPPLPAAPNQDLTDRLDGVIVPVWEGDLYMAKACCASIRRFMGNIPITLWVDGPATTAELERLPNVARIQVRDVLSPEDARLLAGSPLSKLAMFWLSPYERFLCIDADTIVWGDVREYAQFDKYDFIAAHSIRARWTQHDPLDVVRNAFDLDTVMKMDPELEWHGRQFAVTGVFFARRDVYSEERLMTLARMGCWRCYEQGLLNYLMWRGLQDGSPRIGGFPFQVFPPELSMEPQDRFLPADWNKPAVIHWLGKKPKLGRRYELMHEHRELFLAMGGKHRGLGLRLALEDIRVAFGKLRRSLAKRLQ